MRTRHLSALLCSPIAAAVAAAALASAAAAQILPAPVAPVEGWMPGEGPALRPPRITQQMITGNQLQLREIRSHGLRVFATPFNRFDGFGDGPMNHSNTRDPGGRPTLQNNGMFLRVNGLDAQTCMECHAVLSTATVPFRLGIAGIGGVSNNAILKPTKIDVADDQKSGFAAFDGRFINPPFLLGAGGVELAAKEMTLDLQALKRAAQTTPNRWVDLVTKGVSFGAIRWNGSAFDFSRLEGIDDDLVVRPFGRKGEFATTRAIDREAMMFHLGMQPVEVVGEHVDADNDGVPNELLVGEMSALAIFNVTLPKPVESPRSAEADRGFQVFTRIGCAECHVPHLDTNSRHLTLSFPEVDTDPSKNVFYAVDLRGGSAGFAKAPTGGIRVPLYSDLKRHDMGPDLAEAHGTRLDRFFVTARLWGIADTAPYLHDGRALTLSDAILQHGGEGQRARDAFDRLLPDQRMALLTFLRTLHTPDKVAEDLKVP